MKDSLPLREPEHRDFVHRLALQSIVLANIYDRSMQWTIANLEDETLADDEPFPVRIVASASDADSILLIQEQWIKTGKRPVMPWKGGPD